MRVGELHKIGPRLYTPHVTDDPQSVIQRNLWEVVGLLFPGTVLAYRTAIDGGPSPEGTVNLVGGYNRLVKLPGLIMPSKYAARSRGPESSPAGSRSGSTPWSCAET